MFSLNRFVFYVFHSSENSQRFFFFFISRFQFFPPCVFTCPWRERRRHREPVGAADSPGRREASGRQVTSVWSLLSRWRSPECPRHWARRKRLSQQMVKMSGWRARELSKSKTLTTRSKSIRLNLKYKFILPLNMSLWALWMFGSAILRGTFEVFALYSFRIYSHDITT